MGNLNSLIQCIHKCSTPCFQCVLLERISCRYCCAWTSKRFLRKDIWFWCLRWNLSTKASVLSFFFFFFPWFCCCFLGGTLPWTLNFIGHSAFCPWSCISILIGYSFFVVIYIVERKKCNARLFIDSKWLFLIIHHIILQHIRTYRKNFKSTVQTSLVWCSHVMRWKT